MLDLAVVGVAIAVCRRILLAGVRLESTSNMLIIYILHSYLLHVPVHGTRTRTSIEILHASHSSTAHAQVKTRASQ